MNELIGDPNSNEKINLPCSLLEGIFLASVVVAVFNKNGPISMHYLHVSGGRGRSLSASVMSHTHDLSLWVGTFSGHIVYMF